MDPAAAETRGVGRTWALVGYSEGRAPANSCAFMASALADSHAKGQRQLFRIKGNGPIVIVPANGWESQYD